ncbi:hypothetical protein D3C76_1045940 [compost metagenome]
MVLVRLARPPVTDLFFYFFYDHHELSLGGFYDSFLDRVCLGRALFFSTLVLFAAALQVLSDRGDPPFGWSMLIFVCSVP